jgi:hypothetical protein
MEYAKQCMNMCVVNTRYSACVSIGRPDVSYMLIFRLRPHQPGPSSVS